MQEIDNRKRIRGLLALVLSMLMIFGYSGSIVFAVEKDSVPKLPEGSYTLALSLVSTNPDGSKTGIKGAEISIYQVASLSIKSDAAIYSATDDFASAGVDFEGMKASESNDAAKSFAKIVSDKNLAGSDRGISSETGELKFNDLSAGIYLVMLDRYDPSDERYTEMAPFLAMVPGIERSGDENVWISDVTVSPKLAINPKDHIEVNPPVVKKVEGKDGATDLFTFELAADDITNPMPVGSRNGVKQITIEGACETEFGEWRYTEAGSYSYTIREVPGSDPNYEYDSTVYHITDKVSYNGSKFRLERTYTDDVGNVYSGDATAVFEFVNKYNKPGAPDIVDTGDDSKLLMWLIIALASAAVIVALVIRKREKSCR